MAGASFVGHLLIPYKPDKLALDGLHYLYTNDMILFDRS